MTRPGFVDIQLNGSKGINFSNPGLSVEDIRTATRHLVRRGTVAYCPTLVTNPLAMFRNNLPVVADAMEDSELAPHLLGIHLEGPFVSPAEGARGAHPPKYILKPSLKTFDQMQTWARGKIKILTVAPEIEGAIPLIRHAARQGVVVALGHHFASDDVIARAVEAGARACTHLGNGLPNMIQRHHNPLWSQLACDQLACTFITDGHHLPPNFIKVALRAKTIARFLVVSDATDLEGMPPGKYEFLNMSVVKHKNGRISFGDTPYLAGSSATMRDCMNHLATVIPLTTDALRQIGFDNPVKLLGLNPSAVARRLKPYGLL